MSRLSIEISSKQHQHIKALAAMEGISIKEFVMDKLFANEDDEKQSWQKLQQFLTSRLEEAENGDISERSLAEITDAVLDERR